MILPYFETVQVEGGLRVAAIRLTQGTAKPYVVRHQEREEIYVRAGSTSRNSTLSD
jgi:ATP-dependent DNA helicase RecG